MKVDILAIGAHPDDVEISASGTIMKHVEMGRRVAVVDLTEGELGSRGSIQSRYEEAAQASKLMGLEERVNLQMADGFFDLSKVNKIKLIEQIRRFQPEIVLANAIQDRHPDHGRAGQLVSEACFLSGLRKIETSWQGEAQEKWRPKAVYHYIQDRHIEPDFIVDISEYAERKIEVLKAFKTQFYDPNSKEPKTPISGEDFFDFLKGRWKNFGRSIGVEYAEGFTVERPLGVDDILKLK